MNVGGVFKSGIQNEDFLSKENYIHLWKNINAILSQEYNYPIVVDHRLLQGTILHYASSYEAHTTCSLNKRVIAKIRNLMREDQQDIKIANEWEEEEYDTVSRNEDTVYNPIAVPVRTEEIRPLYFVEY